MLGDEINVAGATIDASGTSGGDVRIGGDVQGGGDLQTADVTFVDADSVIRADAEEQGDGGDVVVWADGRTGFFGEISARGGDEGGDGGFVEVSGLEGLAAYGAIDVSAPNGQAGSVLFDPRDITIGAGPPPADTSATFGDYEDFTVAPTADFILAVSTIDGIFDTDGTATVNIRANRDVIWTAGNALDVALPGSSLTLEAGRSLDLDSSITLQNGSLTLIANSTDAAIDRSAAGRGRHGHDRHRHGGVLTTVAGAGTISITLDSGDSMMPTMSPPATSRSRGRSPRAVRSTSPTPVARSWAATISGSAATLIAQGTGGNISVEAINVTGLASLDAAGAITDATAAPMASRTSRRARSRCWRTRASGRRPTSSSSPPARSTRSSPTTATSSSRTR